MNVRIPGLGVEQLSAAAVIIVTLLSGTVIHLTSAMSSIAAALFFVGLLTSNLMSRGWTLAVAATASIATLGPSLWRYFVAHGDYAFTNVEPPKPATEGDGRSATTR